jgi:hypothetical protein
MLRQYDVAVIITVIVERGLQFFCSFVSADDDRWLIGRGTMMVRETLVIFTGTEKEGTLFESREKN